VRPSGDVRDDGGGCDGAHGGAPAGRDADRPLPGAGRSYSCPPTQSTVSSSHSAAPKLNKSRRDVRPRERGPSPPYNLVRSPFDSWDPWAGSSGGDSTLDESRGSLDRMAFSLSPPYLPACQYLSQRVATNVIPPLRSDGSLRSNGIYRGCFRGWLRDFAPGAMVLPRDLTRFMTYLVGIITR